MNKDKITSYAQIYEVLKDEMKWKVPDKRILMTITSLYVMNNKKLNPEQLLQLADKIKSRASLFSSMRSYSRFTTAAMLYVNFENPQKEISTLFSLYGQFKKAKFKSGVYTYIAASILLTNKDKELQSDQIIAKAKDIYEGMKSEHIFLTGTSDYPLAALLAFEEQSDIIQHIEKFYDELAKNGFRKGNDLQFLSHILSLSKEANVQDLISRSIRVSDDFKAYGMKPKSKYYPVIGMLALLPQKDVNMNEISAMYEQLNEEKHFKWQKDLNVTMAVSFYVNEKSEHSGLADASIRTTLEMILQAQQAVMISTIAATTAAANSNNGGGN
ncbi:hypothetical protein CIL05_01900 [Virgibacillus profundi]|uniref:DUF4003 domain-containing protein n=1 Tax=Virgibacillus profundi TaxID=2024555 RepID=A0A2A2IIS0_9BACI|nr:DUF4003 family protein [Virgibacillus profundi]PAV31432.1 hypothetical protein CIL05_01900 [Virgibacillus profundi]PXY55618.1 DUF4003 domain-containing protein [Virgibacillus profundi]